MSIVRRKRNFIVLMAITVLMFANIYLISPIVADYARTLGGLPFFIGIITGTLGAFSCLGSTFSAGMIARIRTRTLVRVVFSLVFISNIMHLLAKNAVVLLFARVIQGFSFGTSSVLIASSITSTFADSDFSKMLGIYSAVQAISQAFAPSLGMLLRNAFGYPGTMLFASCMSLVMLSLLVIFDPIPDQSMEKKKGLGKMLVASESLPIVLVAVLIGVLAHAISSFLDPFTKMTGHTSGVELFFLVFAISMLLLRLTLANYLSRGCLGFYILVCAPISALGIYLIQVQQGIGLLLLAGFLCGVGVGCIQQAALVFLVNSVSPERRNVANSSFFAASSLGRFCCGYASGLIMGSSFANYFYYLYLLPVALLLIVCLIFPRHFFPGK